MEDVDIGHIFRAECDCGFEISLKAGISDQGAVVMAYNEAQTDLMSIDEDQAIRRNLLVIEDPALSQNPENYHPPHLPYGPYRCPKCRDNRLLLFQGMTIN